jgi:hypothetical protein
MRLILTGLKIRFCGIIRIDTVVINSHPITPQTMVRIEKTCGR